MYKSNLHPLKNLYLLHTLHYDYVGMLYSFYYHHIIV